MEEKKSIDIKHGRLIIKTYVYLSTCSSHSFHCTNIIALFQCRYPLVTRLSLLVISVKKGKYVYHSAH